jgi:hypothetical protein
MMAETRIQDESLNLQQIRGIGPGVARRLTETGIGDVAALAVATPESVEAALRGMPVISQERIREWIAAAARLAPPPRKTSPDNGQHYATFRLELLLDKNQEVRRTRVNHVQSGQKASWAGWTVERLNDFVRENAAIAPVANADAGEVAEIEADSPPQPAAVTETDNLYLRNLTVAAAGSPEPRHIVYRGQPYHVRFGVTVNELADVGQVSTRTTTALYARPLGGEGRYRLGQSVKTQSTGPEMAVAMSMVPGAELQPGAYRLEVEIDQDGRSRRRLVVPLNEGMLLVY